MKVTEQDLNQGYSQCHCGGIKLLQAGYEVDLNFCTECREMAASKEEFFMNVGSEVLSK